MHRAIALIFLTAAPLLAGDDDFRRVTLPAGKHTVADVLKAIEAQTGNRAVDRRIATSTQTVDLSLDKQPFWPALDRLAAALDARVSPYGDDGVQLIDGPRRANTVAYTGPCRVEIKSVAVQRDVETGARMGTVQLEVAWEPTREPLYLTLDSAAGAFAADARGEKLKINVVGRVPQPVEQRRAQVLELRMPAPDRSSPAIEKLEGKIRLLGPTRMLVADFDKCSGGPKNFKDDGVTVSLGNVKTTTNEWRFPIKIENPEDTPTFESFQSWFGNNTIRLERVDKNKKIEVWNHRPQDIDDVSLDRRGAEITYTFVGAKGKGAPADWKLVYRTPGRIVDRVYPFEFRDMPLP